MRRLVVCCDGTWNTPEQEDGDTNTATNVVKIRDAVAETALDGTAQITGYFEGVGTDGGLFGRLLGGAIGSGINGDIREAYTWLCDTYEPGDQIYIFGFSRGAYTARSLAGFIGKCGLLKFSGGWFMDWFKGNQVRAAFRTYRDRDADGAAFRAENDVHDDIPIRFLGVWDTVGSLGIPDFLVTNVLDNEDRYTFHDTALGANVATARQALAMDERRENFLPTLWSNPEGRDVQQIWFAGVHGDVGGSYKRRDLGNITLDWMMSQAEDANLDFDDSQRSISPANPLSPRNESLSPGWRLLPTRPRALPELDTSPDIHISVQTRRTEAAARGTPYWSSQSLAAGQSHESTIHAREKWNPTGIYLQAGVEYHFAASGTWLDSRTACGPEGTDVGDGNFRTDDLLRIALLPLRAIEGMVAGLNGGQRSNLPLTKREEDMNWFRLVGAIAHSNVADDGATSAEPHETFDIGENRTYTPQNSGYLYAFANDAWRFYFNNSGHVQLTVTRP